MSLLQMGLGQMILVLTVSGFPSLSQAGEPQIAFTVANDWVDCRLQQDGVAIPGAIVQITDERGKKFAEGITGENGDGTFPLPHLPRFIVIVKIGDRVADPIRLTRIDTQVVPTEVLLSFGLRPCCSAVAMKNGERIYPTEPIPSWLPAIGAAGIVFVMFVVGMLILTSPPTTSRSRKENRNARA